MVAPALGSPGETVAVRRFGDHTVRIETAWGLRVVITSPETAFAGATAPAMVGGVDVLIRHQRPGDVAGEPNTAYAMEDGVPLDVMVDRFANTPRVSVVHGAGDGFALSSNRVWVRWMGDEAGRGHYLIEVDGVTIAYAPTAFNGTPPPADVVLGPASSLDRIMPRGVRYLVAMDAMPDPASGGRRAAGNTLAVSAAATGRGDEQPVTVFLKAEPWMMPAELAAIFDEKEAHAAASMAVFAPMSVEQMNHKPANGTHTPRWNVEHMTGTELGFFSGVYANLDPELRRINRRPAQMPPDYVAREPLWTGAEEARQIERTQAFTRRYAYLLDGLPLTELPEGGPRFARTLAGLFGLMSTHYPEHTAHVVEKTEQPDWPGE